MGLKEYFKKLKKKRTHNIHLKGEIDAPFGVTNCACVITSIIGH